MAVLAASRTLRYAGWSAFVSASLSVIGGIALFLFYGLEALRTIETGDTSGHIFGPISDYASLLQFAFMLPLAVAFHNFAPTRNHKLSRAAAALGILGFLTAVVAQALLVLKVIDFSVNLPLILVALVLIGVWMVVANRLGRMGGALPARLARLGEFTGAVFVLMGSLALLAVLASAINPAAMANVGTFTMHHPVLVSVIVVVFIPGLLANFFGLPIWLIGVGRRLLARA
jgi:hypothetical protein